MDNALGLMKEYYNSKLFESILQNFWGTIKFDKYILMNIQYFLIVKMAYWHLAREWLLVEFISFIKSSSFHRVPYLQPCADFAIQIHTPLLYVSILRFLWRRGILYPSPLVDSLIHLRFPRCPLFFLTVHYFFKYS